MLVINGQSVSLTRGDSAILDVSAHYEDGSAYTPAEGDKIYFRVRKKAGLYQVDIEKEVNTSTMQLSLAPEDTRGLNFGEYRYELELVTAGGFHSTFIANQPFNITEELEDEQ